MNIEVWERAKRQALQNVRMVPPWLVTAGDDGRSLSASHVRSLRNSGIRKWPVDAIAYVSRITKPNAGTAIYRTCEGGHRTLLASTDGFSLIRIAILDDDVSTVVLAQYSSLVHRACYYRPLNFLDKLITYISLCENVAMSSGENMKTYLPTQSKMYDFGACDRLGMRNSKRNLQELNRWARVVYFQRNLLIPRLKRLSGSLSDEQSKQIPQKLFKMIAIPDKRFTSLGDAAPKVQELEDAITKTIAKNEDSNSEMGFHSTDDGDFDNDEQSTEPENLVASKKKASEVACDDESDESSRSGGGDLRHPRRSTNSDKTRTLKKGPETESEDEITPHTATKSALTSRRASKGPKPSLEVNRRHSSTKYRKKKRKSQNSVSNEPTPPIEPPKRFFSFQVYYEYRRPLINHLARGPLPLDLAAREGLTIGLDVEEEGHGVYAMKDFRQRHCFQVHGRIIEERVHSRPGRPFCYLAGLSEVLVTRMQFHVSPSSPVFYIRTLDRSDQSSDANVLLVDRSTEEDAISQERAISTPGALAQSLCCAGGAVELLVTKDIRGNEELLLPYI